MKQVLLYDGMILAKFCVRNEIDSRELLDPLDSLKIALITPSKILLFGKKICSSQSDFTWCLKSGFVWCHLGFQFIS